MKNGYLLQWKGCRCFFGDLRRRSVLTFQQPLQSICFPAKRVVLCCAYIIATEYVGFVYATVKVC